MLKVLMIGLGGFIGANLRYGLAIWIGARAFPVATLTANLIGCVGLGLFAGWAEGRAGLSGELRLLVATGFFGALTTFSTFNLELLALLEENRPGAALLYAGASLSLGLLGGALGLGLGRLL